MVSNKIYYIFSTFFFYYKQYESPLNEFIAMHIVCVLNDPEYRLAAAAPHRAAPLTAKHV